MGQPLEKQNPLNKRVQSVPDQPGYGWCVGQRAGATNSLIDQRNNNNAAGSQAELLGSRLAPRGAGVR